MPIVFVGIKALATVTSHGLAENSEKVSLCGFVRPVHKLIKTINSATSVNRSMWTQEIMQILMVKNGCSVNNVINGCTATVKCRMVTVICLNY